MGVLGSLTYLDRLYTDVSVSIWCGWFNIKGKEAVLSNLLRNIFVHICTCYDSFVHVVVTHNRLESMRNNNNAHVKIIVWSPPFSPWYKCLHDHIHSRFLIYNATLASSPNLLDMLWPPRLTTLILLLPTYITLFLFEKIGNGQSLHLNWDCRAMQWFQLRRAANTYHLLGDCQILFYDFFVCF